MVNIFINKVKNSNYSIESFINGLSDHDAQILVLHNTNIQCPKAQPTIKRQINGTTIAQFKLSLSDENWLDTFSEEDMDSSFNNFLNVYLRHYYHSFPLKKYCDNYTKQGWLTKGIKISCQQKRDLYILCKGTNNSKIINYYKTYCKILSKVIKTAKRHHFNNLIKCSKNKTKTMWNIVKTETNNRDSNDKLPLNIEGNSIKDYRDLANVFNDYFINATNTHQTNDMSKNTEALNNLYSVFNKPFPQFNMTPVNAKK